MIVVRHASRFDLDFVLGRVSPARAAELTATAWYDEPLRMAEEIEHVLTIVHPATPHFVFAMEDGAPIAIVGVLAFGPGFGGMIWAAVDGAPLRTLSGYRWWHSYFVPHVLEKYYRRVEFTALAADEDTRAWLQSVRFTAEGVAYRQGKRGEDFVHYAWTNPDPTVGVVDV